MRKEMNINVTINTTANANNTKEDTTMRKANKPSTDRENTLKMLVETGANVEIKDSIVYINGINLEELKQSILNQGTINYPGKYRRWVMAQMFRALNHEKGYNGYLKDKNIKYVLKTTEDELRTLVKMQKRDPDEFEIRKGFFNPLVVTAIMRDIQAETVAYLEKKISRGYYGNYGWVYPAVRKGDNVTYGRCSRDIHIREFIRNELVPNMNMAMYNFATARTKDDYKKMYTAFKSFRDCTIDLPKDTKKPVAWVEAFKASGAYYTLENMILNHGCVLRQGGQGSKRNLELARQQYCGREDYFTDFAHCCGFGGYKFLGLMKEVIEENRFDFYAKMDVIYGSKKGRW